MKKRILSLMLCFIILTSCTTMFQKGDPYANTSGVKKTSGTANVSNKNTATETDKKVIENNQNIVVKTENKVEKATSETAKKIEEKKETLKKETINTVNKTNEKINNKVTTTSTTQKVTQSTKKNEVNVDATFDETDEKIVDFIAKRVKEKPEQIKQITLDGLKKLHKDTKIRMTKREYLARTYQIINDHKMTSYYLASARLLNQLSN